MIPPPRTSGALLVAALISIPSAAFGQFGVKGGVVLSGYQATHSDARYQEGEDYRPFLGYEVNWVMDGAVPDVAAQAGIFYAIRLSPTVALQPELYLAPRGLVFEEIELYNSSYHLNVNYLQLPLLLKISPFRSRFRPAVSAGAYASLKLSSNRTIDIWGQRETSPLPNVKGLDYGLVLAFGADFPAWRRGGVVEIRLDWGLANSMVQPDEYVDLHADPGRVHVIALALLAGFGI